MEQIDMNKVYKTNFGFAMDYKIGQKNYLVQLIYPQENSSYHIPYILVTPNQMKEMGIDITQQVMKGRTHNNFNGNGVNELGDSFIKETYQNRNCSKQL